ncbi:MAG: hypothetical protein COB30_014225 [Ectothiorhodospiraceae bacterium]|nr:hypothetical protein [Ectothiorhodospiraceae bacterium]
MQKTLLLTINLAVLLFLSACNGDAPSAKDYPEFDTASARLYIAKCGDCHVAPQPSAQTARAWPGILQRMQMRMKAKARKPLDETELDMVLDYVQRHARIDK